MCTNDPQWLLHCSLAPVDFRWAIGALGFRPSGGYASGREGHRRFIGDVVVQI
jgi:hypothetical protein